MSPISAETTTEQIASFGIEDSSKEMLGEARQNHKY